MVGGALVLIPRLVDEKVAQMQKCPPAVQSNRDALAHDDTTEKTATVLATSKSTSPEGLAQANGDAPQHRPAPQADVAAPQDASKPPNQAAGTSQVDLSSQTEWRLVLANKFEPDEASRPALDAIIARMKASPTTRLKVHCVNNINKSSKLAMIGANRIAATIVKEASIPPERIETSYEQSADVEDIEVSVSVQGGEK